MFFELPVKKVFIGIPAGIGTVPNADVGIFEKLAGVLDADSYEILYGGNTVVAFEQSAISGYAQIFQIRKRFQLNGDLKGRVKIIQ